jgi:hypothetical protein
MTENTSGPEPLIAEVKRLSPEPGDILVIKTAEGISETELERMFGELRKELPSDVKCIIASGAVTDVELRKAVSSTS